VFTADLLQRTAGLGDPSTVPIFIVGMPRSGTTLLEQMLASHPDVHGAGELKWIDETARNFRGSDVRGFFPEVAATLSREQLRDLGGRYIQHLRSKSATAARVTDKMPMNFRFAGLIHMTLPHARIIHARRDPIDTCLSCFSKNFSGGIEYAFDLAELGRYWRAYDRLMSDRVEKLDEVRGDPVAGVVCLHQFVGIAAKGRGNPDFGRSGGERSGKARFGRSGKRRVVCRERSAGILSIRASGHVEGPVLATGAQPDILT
jgi:hypothetical protein